MGVLGGLINQLGPVEGTATMAGNMAGELMQGILGGDLPGVLQMYVGIFDSLFATMKPDEALRGMLIAKQMLDAMIEKYSTPAAAPAPQPPVVDDDFDDGGEINHLIHEGRAEKKGVKWNREKYRYETPEGKPLFWTGDATYREVTEEEWQAFEAEGH